jgi:hypothetical protein
MKTVPEMPDLSRLGIVAAALKALIVANEFLESEVSELMQAVLHAYVRGRFKTYTGWQSIGQGRGTWPR